MDFSKYDRRKKKDPEKGFCAADYDDHSAAPGSKPIENKETSMAPGTDQQNGPPEAHAIQPYMESTPILLLVEYLRKFPDKGIILYERDGRPGLRFSPGLNAADMKNGRATISMNAYNLLQDARDDLRDMISRGIEIPLLTHRKTKGRKVQ